MPSSLQCPNNSNIFAVLKKKLTSICNNIDDSFYSQVLENHSYRLTDSSYGDCEAGPVYIEDTLCIRVNLDGHDWYFTNQTDGTYYYYNPIGKYEKVSPVKKSSLFRDDAMSGRGNLWNLILPQLPRYIFIGCGSNSFARAFPQKDESAEFCIRAVL